jgi:ATP-binding cassette, subfamily B, bacterial
MAKPAQNTTSEPHVLSLLTVYWKTAVLLSIATIIANALALVIPKFIATGIDTYAQGGMITQMFYMQFIAVGLGVCVFTYLQGVFQTYVSEKAAYDLRNQLAAKISKLSYKQIEDETPAKLLTNFTADIDAVKMFLSFAVAIAISSIVVIIGATGLLLSINWKLALAVLALLPIIGILFGVVFSKLGPLFKKSQEIVDGFNTIIGESIVGAAIVRVLSTGNKEYEKFKKENDLSKANSMQILKYFSLMIPMVGVIANLAMLVILLLGGKFVIVGGMSLGDFAAFNSYVFLLIFPIIMLGFISSTISRAQESYKRMQQVLAVIEEEDMGTDTRTLRGDIDVAHVSLKYGDRTILHDVSFSVRAGTKTAIIGPTAAGKTQLLQILFGLTTPTSGTVTYDGVALARYDKTSMRSQVAFVFQDSVMFNMSIRENIAFSQKVDDAQLQKAIKAAELDAFIETLPSGLDTVVSERGMSLSGGQKQRIMLARALAINPRILFLDDFTARVDESTETNILANIREQYPDITLISVTQKIQSIEHYDSIILLMEGEIIATGTHEQLLRTSPEYVQIMESQKSTHMYE